MSTVKKKSAPEVAPISTASLPDLVFIILFFFMISTSMKEVDLLVKISVPEATELTKLENKSVISYVYIGPPNNQHSERWGTAPRIQLNDAFRSPYDIGEFIAAERERMGEADRSKQMTSMKVDRETRMGIVTDVKQELRKARAYRISYTASRGLGYH
jgi:biopolymer transport protein ExbD